jgi:hypothetical protein
MESEQTTLVEPRTAATALAATPSAPARGERSVFVAEHPRRQAAVRAAVGFAVVVLIAWLIALVAGVTGFGDLPLVPGGDRAEREGAAQPAPTPNATEARNAPTSGDGSSAATSPRTEPGAGEGVSESGQAATPPSTGNVTGTSPTPASGSVGAAAEPAPGAGSQTPNTATGNGPGPPAASGGPGRPDVTPSGNVPGGNAHGANPNAGGGNPNAGGGNPNTGGGIPNAGGGNPNAGGGNANAGPKAKTDVP